jgi:DNA-binding NarL/FixJ family response regulator
MSHSQPIRVLIVDDHASFRSTLVTVLSLQQDIQVVGQAADGKGICNLCAQLRPDVVLMDLHMPQVNGIEATRQIRGQFPEIQVIVLTAFQEGTLIEQVFQAGAAAYLLKNATLEEIADTIRAAAL